MAHGFLGVTTRAYSVESVSESGARVPLGALVESVLPAGPAARAGLKRGDLIVGFDAERVEYPDQLARWVAASADAHALAREAARRGQRTTIEARVERHPPARLHLP